MCHMKERSRSISLVDSQPLKMKVKVTPLCPTLCDPMEYTVHEILQARILEWVAFPFSRGSSQPRCPTLQVDSLLAEPQRQQRILECIAYPFSRASSTPRYMNQGLPALQADSLPIELSGKPIRVFQSEQPLPTAAINQQYPISTPSQITNISHFVWFGFSLSFPLSV